MSGHSLSTLYVPDRPAWRAEPNYSPAVATALKQVYSYLCSHPDGRPAAVHPNSLPAAVKTYAIANPHRRRRMTSQQRMNLHYALAQSAARMGEAGIANEMLDHALEQSTLLHDRGSTAELLFLSGVIKRANTRTRDSLRDLHASLDIINDVKGSRAAIEPRLELNVIIAIAHAMYFQTDYSAALRWLVEARQLQAFAPAADLEPYFIEWIESLVLRYMGQPERALPLLTSIAARVDSMPSPGALARVNTAIADSALDLAERARDQGEERALEPLFKLAQIHALKGEALGDTNFDEPGAMIARLALVRHSLLSASDKNRSGLTMSALKFAENTQDAFLLAQARTAQAQELLARGKDEVARDLLRLVVTTSAATDAPFIGEAAKKLLLATGGFEGW
jgi:hypothetical protein